MQFLSKRAAAVWRARGGIASCFVVSVALVCVLAGCSAPTPSIEVMTDHRFELWESRRAEHSASEDASIQDLEMARSPDGTWLFESRVGAPDAAEPESGAIAFDRLLLSWNLTVDAGAGAVIEVRVGPVQTGGWSSYLQVGTVGVADGRVGAVRSFDDGGGLAGKIDIDQFVSERHYTAFCVRVTAIGPKGAGSTPPVRIDRLAIWRGNSQSRRSRSISEVVGEAARTRVRNDVPFLSQRTPVPSLSGRLCSPTSLDMVLAFSGVDVPVLDVAQRVRDPDFDIYGNWPRNIQVAFEFGVPGYLTRFSDWKPVAGLLERGQPVIASIAAPKGVLTNAPYKELADGHLIVLTGLDGNGGVYVNDPAAGDAANGQRIYSLAELSKAWLELGDGTAYVLGNTGRDNDRSREEGRR